MINKSYKIAAFDLLDSILCLIREKIGDLAGKTDAEIALKSLAMWLDLYRPPIYSRYKPATIFDVHQVADDQHIIKVEPVEDCTGDVQQVGECVEILMRGVQLEPGSQIIAELFQQPDPPITREPIPCIGLGFQGLGRIPHELIIENYAAITLDELKVRWTAATRGGRIDSATNGLLLRLQGQRVPPEPDETLEPVRVKIDQALQYLQNNDAAAALNTINEALAIVDDLTRSPEPADIQALLNEVQAEFQAEFISADIAVETVSSNMAPPIRVARDVLRRSLRHLFNMTLQFAAPSGSLLMLTEYNPSLRRLDIIATITGNGAVRFLDAYIASFRRTIVGIHGGTLDFTQTPREITISFTLPDPVGKIIDEWIPGWDRFSERSQQILRLLKSGGEVPPQDLLLEGVLEEELERWLMPYLNRPAAINIAHELIIAKDHPGSPERAQKALDQIKKGKPRRELAKPPYAAEIIYLYRTDERHRCAIGAEKLTADDLAQLVHYIWQFPISYIQCLRFIALREAG